MHLPLIDIPKPRRSTRPRCASASLLFGAFLAASWLYASRTEPLPECSCSLPVVPVVAPVKYVTVTTLTEFEFSSDRGCWPTIIDTHEMPLMELYDELYEVEVEAKHHAGTSQGAEMFSFRAEKQFAEKYGLTLKQIADIKREGSR